MELNTLKETVFIQKEEINVTNSVLSQIKNDLHEKNEINNKQTDELLRLKDQIQVCTY